MNCAEKQLNRAQSWDPCRVIFLNLPTDFDHLEKTLSGQPLPKIF